MNRAQIISFCGKVPVLGASLRKVARRYPEGSVVTINSGHLAGYRWQRSHRYVNGYWLGIYELPIQECLVRELRPGDIFFDIGANAGFFTLLGSKCVGPRGKVYSFEPLPENLRSIRAQLELNHATNCTVVDVAVADRSGTVEFCDGSDTSTAHIRGMREDSSGGASISVRTIVLNDFVENAPPPNFIKMDIEGAELAALRGAGHLLDGRTPPKMLIEFHSEALKCDGCSLLRQAGYELRSLHGDILDSLPSERHILCIPSKREGDHV